MGCAASNQKGMVTPAPIAAAPPASSTPRAAAAATGAGGGKIQGVKDMGKGKLLFEHAYMGGDIVPFEDATLSVASSAVLYGLSVYTVFPVCMVAGGKLAAFRLDEHHRRIADSCRMLGIDTWDMQENYDAFVAAVMELIQANRSSITCDVFVRATLHLDALVPGARTVGVSSKFSMFIYRAAQIMKKDGARLKTVSWRRVPDLCIPARAKVNGAYVNSALAKQEALSCGYDDAVFLDLNGHVCESSVANIFIVRRGVLITPDVSKDILEGINRRSIIEMAKEMGIPVEERTVALTELYIADECFCCGTSAFVAPVKEIDGRIISGGKPGEITLRLLDVYTKTLHAEHGSMTAYNTVVGYPIGGQAQ